MRSIYFLLTSFSLFSLSSCLKTGGPCEEPIDIGYSGLAISFRNASGDYLYKEIQPLYPFDSLKIFDAQGRQFPLSTSRNQIPNSVFAYFVVSFSGIYDGQTDQQAFDSEVCKQYYVQYKAAEIDSFTVCFRGKKTKCGSVFDPLNVLYRGQVIKSESNVSSVLFDMTSP